MRSSVSFCSRVLSFKSWRSIETSFTSALRVVIINGGKRLCKIAKFHKTLRRGLKSIGRDIWMRERELEDPKKGEGFFENRCAFENRKMEEFAALRVGKAAGLLMHSWRDGNRGDGGCWQGLDAVREPDKRTITRRQPRDRYDAMRRIKTRCAITLGPAPSSRFEATFLLVPKGKDRISIGKRSCQFPRINLTRLVTA